jgi:hypothetical protein
MLHEDDREAGIARQALQELDERLQAAEAPTPTIVKACEGDSDETESGTTA